MSGDPYKMLRQLKGLDEGPLNNFRLEISKPDGKVLGWFSPLTIHSISDEKIIQNLTDWRSLHRGCFLTQFDPTPARTKKWLEETAIPDGTKILFIMYDVDGIPIGNYGLRDISKKNAELDNLLLGDSKSRGPFILIAMKIFIDWIFSQFGFDYLTAAIFQNNQTALLVHKRLGFEIIEEIPMKKIENKDMIQYVPAEKEDTPDAYIVEMCIKPTRI